MSQKRIFAAAGSIVLETLLSCSVYWHRVGVIQIESAKQIPNFVLRYSNKTYVMYYVFMKAS